MYGAGYDRLLQMLCVLLGAGYDRLLQMLCVLHGAGYDTEECGLGWQN